MISNEKAIKESVTISLKIIYDGLVANEKELSEAPLEVKGCVCHCLNEMVNGVDNYTKIDYSTKIRKLLKKIED